MDGELEYIDHGPYLRAKLFPKHDSLGNDVDDYLQQLIELLFLWNVGVETYDAFKMQNLMMMFRKFNTQLYGLCK